MENVTLSSETKFPVALVEGTLHLLPNEFDLLMIVLAKSNWKKVHIIEKDYVIDAYELKSLKEYQSLAPCYKVFNNIIEMGHFVNQTINVYDKNEHSFKIAEKISRLKGAIRVTLSDEFLQFLYERKTIEQKYFLPVKLKYFMPLKTTYSKHIYLMCKRFNWGNNLRTIDNDMVLFSEKLGIPNPRDKKNLIHVLENSKEEIGKHTDIKIEFELYELGCQGGTRIDSIKFRIFENKESSLELVV